jgi:hypothetical protein
MVAILLSNIALGKKPRILPACRLVPDQDRRHIFERLGIGVLAA